MSDNKNIDYRNYYMDMDMDKDKYSGLLFIK